MKKRYADRQVALWIAPLIVIAILGGTGTVRDGKDAVDEAFQAIRPEAIRADMRFLADDLLEGRATGTRGYEIAAKFMASEFEAMGLEPAGRKEVIFRACRCVRYALTETTQR